MAARVRIRGGRIACASCGHAVTEVMLSEARRQLCRACLDTPFEMAGLRRFIAPDDLCGPNGGCRGCTAS